MSFITSVSFWNTQACILGSLCNSLRLWPADQIFPWAVRTTHLRSKLSLSFSRASWRAHIMSSDREFRVFGWFSVISRTPLCSLTRTKSLGPLLVKRMTCCTHPVAYFDILKELFKIRNIFILIWQQVLVNSPPKQLVIYRNSCKSIARRNSCQTVTLSRNEFVRLKVYVYSRFSKLSRFP